LHRVLLVVCAGLALGQRFLNSFCAEIVAGDSRRIPECTVAPEAMECHNVDGACTPTGGGNVPYHSWKELELSYYECRTQNYPVQTVCSIIDSRRPCRVRLYYNQPDCSSIICAEFGLEMRDCETTQ
jgi:hypothetical protein